MFVWRETRQRERLPIHSTEQDGKPKRKINSTCKCLKEGRRKMNETWQDHFFSKSILSLAVEWLRPFALWVLELRPSVSFFGYFLGNVKGKRLNWRWNLNPEPLPIFEAISLFYKGKLIHLLISSFFSTRLNSNTRSVLFSFPDGTITKDWRFILLYRPLIKKFYLLPILRAI